MPRDRDGGFTLAELMVAMTLIGVFLAVVTGSMVAMYRSSQHSEAVGRTTQEINNAYLWLERTVRYADVVSAPSGSPASVIFRSTAATSGSPTPEPRCFQLALQPEGASSALRYRSWPAGNAAAASGWSTLARGLLPAAGAAVPFVVTQPGDAAGGGLPALTTAQLRISMTAAEGSDRGATSQAVMTFVALNAVTRTMGGAPCVAP